MPRIQKEDFLLITKLVVIVLLPPTICLADSLPYPAYAVHNNCKQVYIRLAEIDTAKRRQPWYKRAKEALSRFVWKKSVTVRPVATDRYKRTVAHIDVGVLNVNREMVRTGNAWVYRKYLKDRTLLDVEKQAREMKKGLWRLPDAERMPPWEWRN